MPSLNNFSQNDYPFYTAILAEILNEKNDNTKSPIQT